MNSLDSVIIKNFQSHELSELQFVDKVNIIIGPSDAGKSAIFRALNWTLTNRPLGDAFRSEWGGDTVVQLQTDEDNVVRYKGKNKNEYQLGDPANPTILKAFGSDPPEDVKNILLMDEINIQSQTDPPFLLVNSPGEVAQLLNQAASIDEIDIVTSNLRKRYNQIRQSIQTGGRWLSEQQEELKEYEDLPALEKQVEELENLQRAQSVLHNQRSKLSRLLQRGNELEQELAKLKNVNKALKILNKAEEHRKAKRQLEQQKEQLNKLIHRVTEIGKNIGNTKVKIQRMQKEYNELAPETCPLCGNPMKVRKQ